jgi:thiol-disulfide isomerase/thioredoxin
MRRTNLPGIPIALLAALASGCASAPEPTPSPTPAVSAPAPERDARAETIALMRRGTLVVGDPAPDFTLADPTGAGAMSLSALRGKPVVLIFGSCTCPPFVRSMRATSALARRYGDRVHFVMVYIREAHPIDGWVVPDNRFEVATPRTLDERRAIARDFRRELAPPMPLLVDTIESSVDAYAPFPNRMYIVDAAGLLAHVGEPGPQSTLTSAREAPAVLERLLGRR